MIDVLLWNDQNEIDSLPIRDFVLRFRLCWSTKRVERRNVDSCWKTIERFLPFRNVENESNEKVNERNRWHGIRRWRNTIRWSSLSDSRQFHWETIQGLSIVDQSIKWSFFFCRLPASVLMFPIRARSPATNSSSIPMWSMCCSISIKCEVEIVAYQLFFADLHWLVPTLDLAHLTFLRTRSNQALDGSPAKGELASHTRVKRRKLKYADSDPSLCECSREEKDWNDLCTSLF